MTRSNGVRAIVDNDRILGGHVALVTGANSGIGRATAATAAVWLALDRLDYVTGATLFVEGGMNLYPVFRGNG